MQVDTFTIERLTAGEGKAIASKETGLIFGKVVYLAKSQTPDDFIEVDEPEPEPEANPEP